MAENLDLLMSELLPFPPQKKIQKQGLTTVQKLIPILANVSKWLKLGPVNVRIITLFGPPKIQKQGLRNVQKIIPSHSQCVKMATNLDLLMSKLLPFWPPKNSKART